MLELHAAEIEVEGLREMLGVAKELIVAHGQSEECYYVEDEALGEKKDEESS